MTVPYICPHFFKNHKDAESPDVHSHLDVLKDCTQVNHHETHYFSEKILSKASKTHFFEVNIVNMS